MPTPFLTAKWQNLVVVNYQVDPKVLEPLIPPGTELDTFDGKAFISLVAFNFASTKLFGVLPAIPTPTFEEINLRFYVKRIEGNQIKRGVTFIKEIVPSRTIAWTARALYDEPYETRATFKHTSEFEDITGGSLSYGFTANSERYEISVKTKGSLKTLAKDSIEEFILEHYWGYTKRHHGTSEYKVEHPPWQYWEAERFNVTDNIASFYGESFSSALRSHAHSVFVARGSDVAVHQGNTLHSSPKGWVLYDGACGFCTWWIPFWRPTIQRAGYDTAPLQAPWVKEKLRIPPDKIASDIRLLLADGTLINGADAYLFGMKQVWWSRPFGHLLSLPGLKWATWKCYKIFNRNRFFISKVCKLPPVE